ncbi:uncharacterized protein EI97DRAFT_371523 [Westerdykella ornata]|uniref:Mitochondrial carrier protein pet8 n=1 Tax=Westerdykella ornata TaxID=318751 RepID=A0A6A6JUQ2_WESOR|nr:uncharacterized protein EI97DRAFT_371523 [Westerdykella ornata]KAF2279476.1 hypothetical protein EI97DRAFT_371523 [Westerdykella ornata]
MSALRTIAARRTPFLTQRAALHRSSALWAGKETRLNTDVSGQDLENKKEEHLDKQKKGEGHWTEELASDSESIVKADRGEIDASEDTMKKLQDETKKAQKGQ